MLKALGRGKDRLTLRFSLLRMFDPSELSIILCPALSCFELWIEELNLALSFTLSCLAKVKLTLVLT
jgi:hypothetical protein